MLEEEEGSTFILALSRWYLPNVRTVPGTVRRSRSHPRPEVPTVATVLAYSLEREEYIVVFYVRLSTRPLKFA